jgi:hypothetical protein
MHTLYSFARVLFPLARVLFILRSNFFHRVYVGNAVINCFTKLFLACDLRRRLANLYSCFGRQLTVKFHLVRIHESLRRYGTDLVQYLSFPSTYLHPSYTHYSTYGSSSGLSPCLVNNPVAILVSAIFPFLSQFFIFCNASNCWVLQLGHATRPTTVGIIKIHPLLVVLSTNSLAGYRHHRRRLNFHFTQPIN